MHLLGLFEDFAGVDIGHPLNDGFSERLFGLATLGVVGATLAFSKLSGSFDVTLLSAHADELFPGLVPPLVLAAVLLKDRGKSTTGILELTVYEEVVSRLKRVEKPVLLRVSIQRDTRIIFVACTDAA